MIETYNKGVDFVNFDNLNKIIKEINAVNWVLLIAFLFNKIRWKARIYYTRCIFFANICGLHGFVEGTMGWFNFFWLIFVAIIMIPNIIFAMKCSSGFENRWSCKYAELIEQVERFGCFGFMIINIPGTYFGWWSDRAFAIYLIVDVLLVMIYCLIWIICFKKSSVFRAVALSVIPSVLFIFSGIMTRSVLLIIASILFVPSHIWISYKNAK